MSNKIEIRRMRSQLRTWELEDEVGFPHSTAFFYEDANDYSLGMSVALAVYERKKMIVDMLCIAIAVVFVATLIFISVIVGVPPIAGGAAVSGCLTLAVAARVHASALEAERETEMNELTKQMDAAEHRLDLVNRMAVDTRSMITRVDSIHHEPLTYPLPNPHVQDVKYMAPLQRQRALSSYLDTPEGRAAAVEQAKEIQHHQAIRAKLDSAARRTAGLDTINNQREES